MKRLIVFAMMIVLAVAVQANAGNMYGGIKGGVNFGDLSIDELDTGMRTGFQGGLYLGTQVSPEFGFRVEGLYVQKGAEGTFPADDLDLHDGTFKLAYIEFPLLFVYNLPAGESLAFNLFAGPTLGFNISSELELEGHGTEDVKDDTESFEFGAAIGAGIEKKMASGKSIGLDVRYSLGATNVTKNDAGDAADVKNRGIGVMAYFQIPMGTQQ